jgi:peptide/nickel transport system ATP-binding protein
MNTPAAAPLLVAEDLARDFDVSAPWLERLIGREPRRSLKAVDGASFSIARGHTLALVGESGCGKSTVARLVTGLYRPSRGRVVFDGVDVTAARGAAGVALRRRMQMIFQDPYASLNPRWRVGDIVAEPARVQAVVRGRAQCEALVAELLQQVGLHPDDARKYPHQFSGGQRQRISIARALSSAPQFLVCDEPTSALDVSVQAQVLNLLADLQTRLGLTCLFISHNLAVVEYVADDIGVMYLGRIVEFGPRDAVLSRPAHPYTRLLLDAVPDLAMTGRARTPVGGEVPNPIDPPAGCAFHPRCPWADARCRTESPAPWTDGQGRVVACHAVQEGRLD